MKEHVHSEQENNSRAPSNNSPTQQQTNTSSEFVDNSSEAVAAQKLQDLADNSPDAIQMQQWQNNIHQSEIQRSQNNTGIPDDLKTGVENASGLSLDGIKVHYNSKKPAEVGAHAYADYPNIYVATGQEEHLPEEVWHLVQQMEGQSKATKTVNGKKVDSNVSRERQAKKKGLAALKKSVNTPQKLQTKKGKGGIIQRVEVEEAEAQQAEVQQNPIQSVDTPYGTFSINEYAITKEDGQRDVSINLEFTPNESAEATEVGLVQTLKAKDDGHPASLEPHQKSRMTKDAYHVDRLSESRNPLYGTSNKLIDSGNEMDLSAYKINPDGPQDDENNTITHAKRTDTGWTKASLSDAPSVDGIISSVRRFETAALALKGKDKGKYYGSVQWGYTKTLMGLKKIEFKIKSMGAPSKKFMEAAEKWNGSKARGDAEVTQKATIRSEITNGGMEPTGPTLAKGDKVQLEPGNIHIGGLINNYVKVKVIECKKGLPAIYDENYVGYINTKYIKDIGNGKDVVPLPIVKALVPKNKKKGLVLYTNPSDDTAGENLDKKVRMKEIDLDSEYAELVQESMTNDSNEDWMRVEIVDGAHTGEQGWVKKAAIKKE